VQAGSRQRTLAYVGTYSTPVDGSGNGKGIYLFEMNPTSGELSLIELAAAATMLRGFRSTQQDDTSMPPMK